MSLNYLKLIKLIEIVTDFFIQETSYKKMSLNYLKMIKLIETDTELLIQET